MQVCVRCFRPYPQTADFCTRCLRKIGRERIQLAELERRRRLAAKAHAEAKAREMDEYLEYRVGRKWHWRGHQPGRRKLLHIPNDTLPGQDKGIRELEDMSYVDVS